MHEASIVQELVDLAARRTPAGSHVVKLFVSVGRLTGVSPDAMQFYFEVLGEEALGGQAELIVTLAPLRGHCRACGALFEVAQQIWLCPSCDQPTLEFVGGDELDLTGLAVDLDEPHHD